jgi:hypothetical protein
MSRGFNGRDEAASGGWFTARIIHLLGQQRGRSLRQARNECILKAFLVCQQAGNVVKSKRCKRDGKDSDKYPQLISTCFLLPPTT